MFKRNTMGFIKLRRDIQEWEWYGEPIMVAFWIHLLINANWEDKEWRGEQVQRGQLITSLSNLSTETGLSVKQVRIALARLEKGKQIVSVGASKWTKITICDYDNYMSIDDLEGQTKGTKNGKQTASEGQAKGKHRATIEEDKEVEEGNNKNKSSNTYPKAVEELYALYPTVCPTKGRSIKKGDACKKKLVALLKSMPKEEIERLINNYVAACKTQGLWMQDFLTFLHQRPEYEEPESSPQGDLFAQTAPQQEPSSYSAKKPEDNVTVRPDGTKVIKMANGFTFTGR